MDGLTLKNQMMQSLAMGLKTLAEERKTANGSYHDELVGRMDAMRNMLEFLISAEVDPCPGADDNAKEARKDPGPPEVPESPAPKPMRKRGK